MVRIQCQQRTHRYFPVIGLPLFQTFRTIQFARVRLAGSIENSKLHMAHKLESHKNIGNSALRRQHPGEATTSTCISVKSSSKNTLKEKAKIVRD